LFVSLEASAYYQFLYLFICIVIASSVGMIVATNYLIGFAEIYSQPTDHCLI